MKFIETKSLFHSKVLSDGCALTLRTVGDAELMLSREKDA